MTRITKLITLVGAGIAGLDLLLMIINGTMLYVLITIGGFYLIISLAFKENLFRSIKRWVNTGRIRSSNGKVKKHEEITSRY
ncbi:MULTISPECIES: hypothetical protein [Leuconostoc]|uniref:hypothetical protein n=1 Tax=Leuconostoc TaxID=1243 RepID=UPI0032DEF99D